MSESTNNMAVGTVRNNPTETCGVLYAATREPYLSEAEQSAESVRNHHPDLPITLYAPEQADTERMSVFDDVHQLDDVANDFSDSNLTSDRIPYDRNLFLDSDTYVCGSLYPIFDLLDRVDVAAAQDPAREGTAEHTHEHDVPESFPQLNTGVVGYRDSEEVRRLFDRWNHLYNNVDGVAYGLNQPTFRMAAYESDLNIGTLPPEYNFRIGNVANSVGYACGEVRIIHGRSFWWDIDELAERINATDERRVVVAKPRPVEVLVDGDRSATQNAAYAVDRAHWAFRKYGAVSMLKTIGAMAKQRVVR